MNSTLKLALILLIFSVCGYALYLTVPYVVYESNSPYGNAEVRKIIHGRRPSWITLYFTYEPMNSHYEILYNDSIIAEIDGYCSECLEHRLLNIDWHYDSVEVVFETHYEKYDTIHKVCKLK